jgi:formate dehydrogenase (NADP+) beta subunit
VKPTDIKNTQHFHKVVDCQYACPAHTPVPEYIRLIALERYTDAYMINWQSNVFPGILGRTCDRPCESACRRRRVEEEPVAICRLKRVAADKRDDIEHLLPPVPVSKNGKRVALIGAGPASLTVARDLAPLGYSIDIYDNQFAGGGMMRSQIPSFRLPEEVLDEEVNYIVERGVTTFFDTQVDSMKEILEKDYDAVFVGTGAPRGRGLDLPGLDEAGDKVHLGVDWLANVAFEHTHVIGKRVLVLGGGNTAMDCCRSARRMGGEDVRIVVRSPFGDMKASAWEKEDAIHEGIPIFDNHTPKEYVIEDGNLKGMLFEKVEAQYDANGKRSLIPTGEDWVFMEADEVLVAIGQDNAFPWIERDQDIEFGKWDMPVVDKVSFQSTNSKVFFGGDAAFGPDNIITAVAQGHEAATSIHLFCQGKSVSDRPAPFTNLLSQKMGVHEWIYDNAVKPDERYVVPMAPLEEVLADRKLEVELGFDSATGYNEAGRCLNCDVQTVFMEDRCIECDACMDVCPTDCISFVGNAEETELRSTLSAPAQNLAQDLYVSAALPTRRVMVKDENVCLHCGLCAERCPTTAWDMQKYIYNLSYAGQ